MEQKIRILHVVGRMDIGGAESRIMDLYRNIDREKIQFDFIQHTADKGAYQEEVEKLGGHVYSVPRFRVINYFSYRKSWREFFKNHPEIRVVHGHMTSTAGIYLPIAKMVGKVYTIAHARSAGVEKGLKGLLTKLLRHNLSKKCDQCFTCSKLAGEAVFGKKAVREGKVTTIPNAIEVERFVYNEQVRKTMRESLHIGENDFVIGHVGRFVPVKNHEYLLQILEACLEKEKSAKLLLIGDGGLRQSIAEKAENMQLSDHIIFAGNQKKVEDFYQAMDFFLLPSFYEGLPGTAIEAQTSGLPGILSEWITEEAIITDLMKQKSIELPAKEWADAILERKPYCRKTRVEEVKQAGFDAGEQAKRLSQFYLEATGK
ncbi:MAG: glycosyltransferase family 1 protein [Lachnospiraceae bacterium]|nr:glycosyltransferase family 1 protein [Lachnospiraceae bacterium]